MTWSAAKRKDWTTRGNPTCPQHGWTMIPGPVTDDPWCWRCLAPGCIQRIPMEAAA